MARASPCRVATEVLAGLVERVTFHNDENGFCVLRVKARGHRDSITVVGHAAMISAGEFVTASGEWVNDRTHGVQFRALRTEALNWTPCVRSFCPRPARLDELAGRNHRCVAENGDQVALTPRLYPQHAEPVLLVVEGDALHQASEDLGRCACAGWLPHGGDLILAPHATHASRDIDPYALARVSCRQASGNTRPSGSFEEAEQLVGNEAGA